MAQGTWLARAAIAGGLALLVPGPASAAQIYQWTDDRGVVHFATSIEDVPAAYRDRARAAAAAAPPAAATATTTVTGAPAPAAAAPPAASEAGGTTFEIPYRPLEGSARRVIIDVTFNDRVRAPMLLDTGSPGMLLSVGLAVKLGLFSSDAGTLWTETAGIGGSQLAVRTIVESVSVGSARDTFVPTTVTDALSPAFEGLIGLDFLAGYSLRIDTAGQVVIFEKNPPDPNARGGHDEAWWRRTFREFREDRERWRDRRRTFEGRPDSRTAKFLEYQARESERLLQRLEGFASDHAVPQHWR